jgi:CxxC motif-containing protein (DUF1111 family)
MFSLRNTQALFGLGFLEAVPQASLQAIAQHQKTQGLNGRINYVRDDIQRSQAVGRFGWKAAQPSIRQQTATAFLGDMGVTSSLYIEENCPPVQTLCLAMPPGNRPELLDYNWDQLEFWQAALAPPPVRHQESAQVRRGQILICQRSKQVITLCCQPLPTPLFMHSPICYCMTWVKNWLMADPNLWRECETGVQHLCGA